MEVFTVNSSADTSDPGTLRRAIADANASAADETVISLDLPDGATISLGNDLPWINHPQVTISNAHPFREVTIDGNGLWRMLFKTGSSSELSVMNLTLTNGWMDGNLPGSTGGGACLYSPGHTSLSGVTFRNCQTINGSGAALYSGGGVSIIYSEFVDNTVIQDGTPPVSRGGALFCAGASCEISASRFSGNRVLTQLIGQSERGGGAAYLQAGSIDIEDSTFIGNEGRGRGGALHVVPDEESSHVEVRGSLFRNNVGGEGGAIWVQGTEDNQSFSLLANSFEGNTATVRSAALRTAVVSQIEISGNVFSMQSSIDAGASGTVEVFGNNVTPSTVTLDFNTFVGDDDDSYLFRSLSPDPGNVTIARMHANIFDQRSTRTACSGSAVSTPSTGKFNVVSDDSCTGTIEADSLVNVDPLLHDAISQSDRTLIYPKAASPAVDIVSDESLVICSGRSDLDDIVRPLDGDDDGTAHCDAGALERNVRLFADRFQ